MSAESPRHTRTGGPLVVPSQPPSDRTIIDAVSGFINDVKLTSSSNPDPKDTILWARFETADINEPTPEGDNAEIAPLLLVLGYGSGVQVWLIPPSGEAQEVLSWRQGTVRVLRILPTPISGDSFASKRPLIALCDSVSPGPTFCSLSFISIRGGEQVKSIKFKNPILDVLANKRSVVVSFSERFAVFDAGTLEDRMAVTTCYPCPCPLGGNAPINPLALGDRWLAYADKKLNAAKRSSGGCEAEGVTSYTATVLHAAKSLGKGLRGLGESVAQSLAGGARGGSPPHPDGNQPGVVTVIDIEGIDEDDTQDSEDPYDPIVAHFIAHSDTIIAMKFDASGMLLITADRRGHDFHVFRINPHPCGPSLASVHHLYILHRGDTTAKVQDIAVSADSRWAAVSTLRGTTHVFPLSSYGGAVGVRTHCAPRHVNRLSRFQRSAGLPLHASPCASPVNECGGGGGAWFPNPRTPPYPTPLSLSPLAQLRPTANLPTHTITRNSSGRQRLSSLSEDPSHAPLLAGAKFGPAPASASTGAPGTKGNAALSLYLMAANGSLMHLVLTPKPSRHVPKEKISDESPIELSVEGIAQWPLQRPAAAADLLAPLPPSSPLLQHNTCRGCADICVSDEERWLSQVEIVTHAGPHRRLWMGPQFVFKTYTNTGSTSSLSEAETVEIETSSVARSNPVNMPGVRPIVPVLIDSGSASSLEHSPSDSFRRKSLLAESGRAASVCDVQLREDLAEAMKEEQGAGRATEVRRGGGVARDVDPLGTVVRRGGGATVEEEDPDRHTSDNADEARFRPVVRCAAPPPPAPRLVRPLPRDTRIPAQSALCPPKHSPDTEPRALPADTVIPAALQPPPSPPPVMTPPPVATAADPPAVSTTESEREVATIDETNAPEIHAPIQEKKEPETKPPATKNAKDKSKRKEREQARNESKKLEASLEKRNKRIEETKSNVDVSRDNAEREQSVARVAEEDRKDQPKDEFTEIHLMEKDSETVPVDDDVAKIVIEESTRVPTSEKHLEKSDKIIRSQEIVVVEEARPIDQNKEKNIRSEEEPSLAVTIKLPSKNIEAVKQKRVEDEIKTEDQAWDMLLNEPEKNQTVIVQQPMPAEKNSEETKTRPKRNRKNKKIQEAAASKSEEDSFVEIHAIDEKPLSTTDVVAISASYDNAEVLKPPKFSMRSTKSATPERSSGFECKTFTENIDFLREPSTRKFEYKSDDDIGVLIEPSPSPFVKYEGNADNFQVQLRNDGTESATSSYFPTELTPKNKKSKSLSPYLENSRKLTEKSEQKDLIVIDTIKESFPEIQITKGTRHRKRSPQIMSNPIEITEPIVEKSVKSWSTIAASKSFKKPIDVINVKHESPFVIAEQPKSSKESSVQDKLIELYNRSDVMVAECDAPSQLTFVEEHHTLPDLPPLEPINFALDDFKLDIMKDSLLDTSESKMTSPICKINIDDILSTIKGTASKVIEASTYNMVDLEKVSVKREGSFNVVENEKITTQEVNLKVKREKEEMMEKSSDDDNTSPVLSTDSDKDEKKPAAAASSAANKSAKSKKSRRKKK